MEEDGEDDGEDCCGDEIAEWDVHVGGEVFDEKRVIRAERNGEEDGGEVPCEEHDEFDRHDGAEEVDGDGDDGIHCDRWEAVPGFLR